MEKTLNLESICSGIFAVVLITVGMLNLFLVHPVPGTAYLFLSIIYYPQTNNFLRKRFGFSIPLLVKIALGIVVIIFTLGVSDLGDMIDKAG
ncbi:hypothetical protein GCM10027443_25250 [Pontibacter brevis]